MASSEPPGGSSAGEHHPSPEVAILFVGLSLALGVVCRQLLRGSRVPYTVALLLVGVGLGAFEHGARDRLGDLGASIRMWSDIDPNLILFIFLPALLFESSFALEIHQIKRCLLQIVLLAGPGVVIVTFSLGFVHKYLFPYGWDWSTSLLLGGLLGATDPVAVVALLKELGVSKKLSTLIEGEALMNDGVAIVMYRLFLRMTLGQRFNAGDIILFLARVSLGAVAMGLGFGLVSIIWLGTVFNDTVIEIILTFTASYMAFFVAEDEAEVSGVLTVMTVGIFFAAFVRTAFTGESEKSMHYFWEMIAYVANTLIFILSGVIIAESMLRSSDTIDGRDWGYLAMLYIFVQLSRGLLVVLLYPGLRYSGYGIDWRDAIMIVWGGLRGAVALSLSLLVAQTGDTNSMGVPYIPKKTQAQFVFFTGGVVLLTLIVNGSTTQFLVHALGLTRPSEIMAVMLDYAKFDMYGKALDAYGDLLEDEDLGPADWATVKEYVSCLNLVSEAGPPIHPHESAASGLALRIAHLQDTRLRFLHGVRAAYWKMLEERRVTKTAALLLMQSVDEALDKVAHHQPIQDWKGLHPYVHLPRFLKNLKYRRWKWVPQRLVTSFLVERLELGCYISAGFLRAHRQVRQQLRDFLGESMVADDVIAESDAEAEEAKEFLEDVRLSFPQVLRGIKTKQVTHAILEHLSDHVENLEKAGLLGEKEILHLHESVQVDLKHLMRNPPSVKIPITSELLRAQPLIGALPADVQEPLMSAAKEFMKWRGTMLFSEGSSPEGIWLIANGILQWSSRASEHKKASHSTFYHASVLGLYESLTGKPYICSISCDSAVHCFFIERTKVLAVLQSEPELDEYFWQESAIVVAKIVMPHWFESIAMQELRAAILEGACLKTYINDEVFEVRHGEVGILLEGHLKVQGKDAIISAPAGLVSESYSPITGSGNRGTYFHVETRSRVIVFGHNVLARKDSVVSLFNTRKLSNPTLDLELRRPSRLKLAANDSQILKSSHCMARALELGLTGSAAKTGEVLTHAHSRSYPTLTRRILQAKRRNSSPFQLSNPTRFVALQPTNRAASSDDSDGEEDHIVEIESPSTLFQGLGGRES